eukprot:m.104838 g.104838  ORF g.104838 m.104838 type:complete len:353 (+) comp12646_c0_seq4:51-1109(+)
MSDGNNNNAGVCVWCVDDVHYTDYRNIDTEVLEKLVHWCGDCVRDSQVNVLRIFLVVESVEVFESYTKQLELMVGELYDDVDAIVKEISGKVQFDTLIIPAYCTAVKDLEAYPFMQSLQQNKDATITLEFFGDGSDTVRKSFEVFFESCNVRFTNIHTDEVFLERVASEEVKRATRTEKSSLGQTCVRHDQVCLGGTFDHLHRGHKLLLTAACLIARNTIHVGVTCEDMLKNKKHLEAMQSLDIRKKVVEDALANLCPNVKANVFTLTDAMGTAATEGHLTCLIASMETQGAISAINSTRMDRGLLPLDLHVVPLLPSGIDNSSKISSTFIRECLLKGKEDISSKEEDKHAH